MISISAESRPRAALLGLALLAAATLFSGLGRYPLWEPDEGRHAEIAREIGTGGSWIVPTLNGSPYHDKPILYYWLTALAYRLGGTTTAMARTVSASAALATLLAAVVWAGRVWGRGAAACAGLTLLGTLGFVALGRFGDLNMLLTLWVTLGVLGVHRWAARDGHGPGLLVAAVACALGALTKGLVSPALIGAVSLVQLWRTRRLHLLRRGQVVVAATVFVVVAAPWYIAAGLESPDYLRDFFVRHHLNRALGGRFLHPEPWWYTAVAAVACFLPWTPLLPAAVHRAWRARDDDDTTFCLLWAAVVVLLFTLPAGKLATYVLPAMPPLALVVGRYWSRLGVQGPDLREASLLRGGLALIANAALLAPILAIVVTALRADARWVPVVSLSAVLVPFGLATAWLARTRRYEHAPAVLVAAMLTAWAAFYGAAAPEVSAVVSDAPIARAIAAADPGRHAPVIAFRTYGGSLSFYLDRPVRLLDRQRRLRRVLARRPLVFVVTHGRHLRALRRMQTLYPWWAGRHLLLATRPPPAG